MDLRLPDLLPAEELDLADDLLPTLPSSLRLALRDCKEGKLLCLESSDLRLLLLLAMAGPPFAVAGRRRGLLVPLLDLTRLGTSSSLSDSVSISSAKSTSGAFFRRDDVCVPDVLVGEPTAIVPRLAILLVLAAAAAVADVTVFVAVTGRLPAAGDRDLARPVLALALALALAPALFVARTGDRDRVLGAVGDLARIAAARALAALVIRTGDLDLAVLLLALVVRIGDLERPLLRAFVAVTVAVAGPSKVEVEVVAEADLVVRRIGDLDLVLLAVVLFLVIPLPTPIPMPSLSVSFLVEDLALVLDLDLGTTTTGRFGES